MRYTSVSGVNKLVGNYTSVLNDLIDNGYRVIEVKNTWIDDKNPYKGVNVSILAPSGQKFELQFHTPESLEAKEVMHKLYEEARLPTTPLGRKNELVKEMCEISRVLEKPKNIELLKSIKNDVTKTINSDKNKDERISLDDRIKKAKQSSIKDRNIDRLPNKNDMNIER